MLFQKQLQATPLVLCIEESLFAISYDTIHFTVGLLTDLGGNGNLHYMKSNLESPINCLALVASNDRP